MPFFGEYECKLDSKGRLRLPSPLIRQMEGESGVFTFVVQRGFEKCLMLYEKRKWDEIVKEVEGLNVYNRKERQFLRYFFRGATVVGLDASDRILLSRRQLDFAGIDSDVILSPLMDRIEIWSPSEYEAMVGSEPSDLSELAEQVMGGVRGEQAEGQ